MIKETFVYFLETSICTSWENKRKWCLGDEKMRGNIKENEWEKEKVKEEGMRDEIGEREYPPAATFR